MSSCARNPRSIKSSTTGFSPLFSTISLVTVVSAYLGDPLWVNLDIDGNFDCQVFPVHEHMDVGHIPHLDSFEIHG